MEIEVHDEKKYVGVWVRGAESERESVRQKLKSMYRVWSEKKYKIVVFESGKKDLTEQTKELLRHSLETSAREER